MYQTLLDKIDQATASEAESGFRSHLGGSLIGRACEREIWYGFRWTTKVVHQPRMLRLFARGQREEAQFVSMLRKAGVEVREFSQRLVLHPVNGYDLLDWDYTGPIDPEIEDVSADEQHVLLAVKQNVKPKQWRISDIDGHFGGSLDGIAACFPEMPSDAEGLLEFKTHNTKSFVNLVQNGVKIAKPEHYKQMQIYMHKKGLKFAVYGAVNKNDDDLWWEFVEYDPKVGVELLAKATRIIHSKKPPDRISNSPAWYACKFCDHKRVCHFAEPPEKNCRTCEKSTPVADGKWFCSQWNNIIPGDFQLKGCEEYKAITD